MYLSSPHSVKSDAVQHQAAPATAGGAAFQRLLDIVTARREEFDRLTYVPRDVVELMKEARIFRASTPARFGGDALAPHLFLRMIERIAEIDGSAAWVAAFGSSGTYLAALPVETQARIYADGPDQVFAGGLYPLQPAKRAEGGWTVSGRWRFASGCKGADWIGVGIMTGAGGEGQPPVAQLAVCRAEEVEIIDNWNVVGMQGTGSHDTTVKDKFYPDDWICLRGAPGLIDEPLYHYPALPYQAQVHAAVNLGLARASLDLAIEMSGAAKIMPGAARLVDRAYFKTGLAQAEARLRGARLFYYDMAEKGWEFLVKGTPVPLETKNLMRLSATHAAHSSAEVIQLAYRIVGMAAVEKSHRMQQIVRDSMVVTQHAALNEGTFEAAGAILAGAPAFAGYPG